MHAPRILALTLALSSGCVAPVLSQYQEARQAALSDLGAPPPDWKPDAVVHLSPEALDAVLSAVLDRHGTLRGKVDAGIAVVRPRLRIDRLAVARSAGCADCVAVDLSLTGHVKVDGVLGQIQSPVDADVAFDAVLSAAADDDGAWHVSLEPRRIRDVAVTLGGTRLAYASIPLRDWIDTHLLANVGPQRIVTLGSADAPLRGVRIAAAGRHVQVRLLTAAPRPQPISLERQKPAWWQLDIHPDALVGLAAVASYEAGPVSHDVVPVPTSLAVDPHGGFTMGLRLWRLKGRGWWRDYVVEGTTSVEGRGVRLRPVSVEEAGKSKGAVWVDPLAALGEGVILKTIERVLETSVPANHTGEVEGVETQLIVEDLRGRGGLLQLSGSLAVHGLR